MRAKQQTIRKWPMPLNLERQKQISRLKIWLRQNRVCFISYSNIPHMSKLKMKVCIISSYDHYDIGIDDAYHHISTAAMSKDVCNKINAKQWNKSLFDAMPHAPRQLEQDSCGHM